VIKLQNKLWHLSNLPASQSAGLEKILFLEKTPKGIHSWLRKDFFIKENTPKGI
jgi:hypothetical protein